MTQIRLFPAEMHTRALSDGNIQLKAFDDQLHPEGQILLTPAQAELLLRDLATTLGFTLVESAK